MMDSADKESLRRPGALLALLVVLFSSVTLADPAPAISARQVVENALDQVIRILNEPDASEESRKERIAAIAYDHFDFDTMSKLVIARPWRKFTPEQRREFIEAFKVHLANSYGRRLSRYEGIQIKFTSEVAEQRGDISVHTEVVGGSFDGAQLSYRMREEDGRWRVIDVVIEGVSLISNFRSQFQPIVSEGGAPLLLRRLKEKNEELADEPDEPASPESAK